MVYDVYVSDDLSLRTSQSQNPSLLREDLKKRLTIFFERGIKIMSAMNTDVVCEREGVVDIRLGTNFLNI